MKVQPVRLPGSGARAWMLLDDAYKPVEPVCAYLKFRLVYREESTVRREAYHLKLYWDYLTCRKLDWRAVDLPLLAGFIEWLRDPELSLEAREAQRTDATIDLALCAVHEFYTHHCRLGGGKDLGLYEFVMQPQSSYKPFLYGIAQSRPIRRRILTVKRERRLAKTLSQTQIDALRAACAHVRDEFLVVLLHDTGIRIGEALGLRHEDIKVEDGSIVIVPRKDNVNGARVKSHEARTVYPSAYVVDLYVRYVVEELNGLESDTLPDYVFVNLWGGELGQPMDYDAVRSLYRRLQRKVLRRAGLTVPFTPHKLRHSFATEKIKAGMSLPTVSHLLGHGSIQTTVDIYNHVDDEDVRKALRAAKQPGSEA